MESNLNLESITNGLSTLQRLKQLYSPAQRDENDDAAVTVQPDRLALLQDTLTSISDFLPATRGSSFHHAFRMGSHYSSAYRGIKQHFRNMSGAGSTKGIGAGLGQLMKTLKVVSPVLNTRDKVYMDKVIKIFDILGS